MSDQREDRLLRHAARRARDRDGFVAAALHTYQSLHGLGDDELAAFLGCAPELLPRLALCRRPDPDPLRFRAEVEAIAAYTGADSLRLAQVLREAAAARAFRAAPDQGMLLAARDRISEEPSQYRAEDAPETGGGAEPGQP